MDRQRNVGNPIKKQCAVVSLDQQSVAVSFGARKSASQVTKHFGFRQRWIQSCNVHVSVRPIALGLSRVESRESECRGTRGGQIGRRC